MDGWMDEQTDGQTDGQIDRWMDEYAIYKVFGVVHTYISLLLQ